MTIVNKTSKTIIIPGMGYSENKCGKSISNKFVRGLPNSSVSVFNYQSKGIVGNISRFVLNYSGRITDAQKRLAQLIENSGKNLQIIAHSHGALILYSLLNNCSRCRSCRDNISKIITFGAANMIPPDYIPTGNVVNVYHTDDWVLKLFYPNVKKIISQNNSYGVVNEIAKFKVILFKQEDIEHELEYCTKSGTMSHLLECYKFYFRKKPLVLPPLELQTQSRKEQELKTLIERTKRNIQNVKSCPIVPSGNNLPYIT